MEVNGSSNSPNRSRKTEEQDIPHASSLNVPDPPRKRSNSLLHWMQKNLTPTKPSHTHHKRSPPRQRSATTTLDTDIPSTKSPPVSMVTRNHGRPRASTIDSVGSTGKKPPRPKKVIFDTDEKAQQSPSMFQYVFGR